jgi:hypothetical protein
MKNALRCLAFALVGLWFATASAADGQRYFGHHPMPPDKGGFCYLLGSHTHPFKPPEIVAHLFRLQGGHYYFVGDPYHFGYGGPAYGYDSHHPIHAAFGGGWCYLDGPHYHIFHPHRDDVRAYVPFGDRYYYIGPVSAEYQTGRPKLYVAEPEYVTAPVYADIYANRFAYAIQFGHPASVTYVAAGKLPKAAYVPGVYSAAYFGVPGFHAGVAIGVPGVAAGVGVAVPGVSAGIGVSLPGVSAGIGVNVPGVSAGFGVGVVGAPGVVVVPAEPAHVPPGWYRGKKKGWKKRKYRW